MKPNKKAQITMFMIIGIVLVSIFSVFLYFNNGVSESIIEEATETVPLEVKPIQNFVESCLNKISKEAFVVLGSHGGYIDMLDADYAPEQYTIDSMNPTEADGATLTLNPSTHVAYWWMLETENNCNNCNYGSNQPSIELIQIQIETYVKTHLDKCINDFEGFEKQGFKINEITEFKPKITIAERDVVAFLDYQIQVSIGDRNTTMKKFVTKLPLEFKKIYEFSQEIVDKQKQYSFLEYDLMYLISLNSPGDMNKLPPIYLSEDSYVPKMWSKSLVSMQIKDLLTSHIHLIQLNQTKDAKLIQTGTDFDNLYSQFFLPNVTEDFVNYSVKFIYLNWPIYFDITPSDGEMIIASEVIHNPSGFWGFDILPAKPTRIYRYNYDISAPVIVEISSDSEFFGEGYRMYFALEANIRQNLKPIDWFEGNGREFWDKKSVSFAETDAMKEAKEQESPDVDISSESEQAETAGGGDGVSQAEDGLASTDKTQSTTPIKQYTKSLFCSLKQRVTDNITIIVKDKNGSVLDDVDVSYACGNYDNCKVGKIIRQNETDDPNLIVKLPMCYGGGIFTLKKEGYLTERIIDQTTTPGQLETFEFEMQKKYTKKVNVKKHLVKRLVSNDSLYNEIKILQYTPTPTKLNESEMVLINIIKLIDNPWEEQISKFIMFYGDSELNTDFFTEMELVPGNYKIDATYFYLDNINLSANCSHMCDRCDTETALKTCRTVSPDSDTSYECEIDEWSPEEDVILNTHPLGGYQTNETDPWVVTESSLETGEQVEFHVVASPIPRCIPDLQETADMFQFYEDFRYSLNPKLN
ncbi:hypothetical protein HN587_06260 [Candidatus Woesearchaeota archaeon]|jgi:hypothetical protein|nr:hypothetical protein [Candidatus Woesearchaeota archaeon]